MTTGNYKNVQYGMPVILKQNMPTEVMVINEW